MIFFFQADKFCSSSGKSSPSPPPPLSAAAKTPSPTSPTPPPPPPLPRDPVSLADLAHAQRAFFEEIVEDKLVD